MIAARESDWPGAERRRPPLSHPAWLVLRPLATSIEEVVSARLRTVSDGLRVLDVGCGEKPYLPLFAAVASEYVGLDVEAGPHVDVVAPAEELPFGDESFDVVLCSQTLEHVDDPARVVRETHRVLRPGGFALFSTHGTAVYHPCPGDLWRWTQEGLVRLFRDGGAWSELELRPAGGTAACFGYLIGFYVAATLRNLRLGPLQKACSAAINVVFAALDRVIPLHYPRRYTLIANFLVIARKPATLP